MTTRFRSVRPPSFLAGLPAVAGVLLIAFSTSSNAQANCTDTPVGLFCEQVSAFSTQANIWGPGNARPADATIRIFQEGWNLSGGANGVTEFSPFGSFGGSVNASTNGTAGIFFGIRGMNGGQATVDYSALMRTLSPRVNGFRPNRLSRITFSGIPQLESNLSTTGELSAGLLSLWGELGLNASAGGTACVFDCVGATLPSIGFDSFGDGGFPLPPGTSFEDGRARQLVFELPVGLERLVAGPVRDEFLQLFQGNCPARKIEIEEFSPPYDKSGVSGCLGLPGFPTESELGADNRSLIASRLDTFVDLEVDLDFWASKIRGVPPLSYSQDFGPNGAASAFIDGLDIDVRNRLSLRQTLTFTPNPTLELTFPFAIDYSVVVGGTNTVLRSGNASTIQLAWGENLLFVSPPEEFGIQTRYTLPNTFANDSELIYEVGFVERILEGGFQLGGIAVGTSPIPICKPWPGYSCWYPAIYSPSINFGVGPLKTFSQGLATLRDSSLFDNNRPPWSLTGFTTVPGPTLPHDPAFLPELMIQGVPTAPVPEGSSVTITTTGSFDPDGDLFRPELELFRRSVVSPPVVFLLAPEGQTDATFEVDLIEQGAHRLIISAFDQTPGIFDAGKARRDFTFQVVNVAPEVQVAGAAVAEGEQVEIPFTVTDAGVEDRQSVVIDWADGTPTELVQLDRGGGSGSFSHIYADNGDYPVRVCATDDDGATTCEIVTVSVSNVAPEINSVNSEQILNPDPATGGLDAEFQFAIEFQDAGVADSHMAELIWDADGLTQTLEIQSFPFGPPGRDRPLVGNAFGSANRSFTTPGTRTSVVCVTDDDGAETCVTGPSLIIPEADLAITGSADPSPARIGEPVSFGYQVTNNGPDTAGGVSVTIELPRDGQGGLTGVADGNVSQELLPFDLSSEGQGMSFGSDLAAIGNTLAVGAESADSNPGIGLVDEGAVYVFYLIGDDWVPAPVEIRASSGELNDGFGDAVALSADESTLVVGAPGRGPQRPGGVYVFERDRQGTGDPLDDTWTEVTLLQPPESSTNAQVGVSVAIEGNVMVAGAFGDGAAYVFERDLSGQWQQVQQLTEDPVLGNRLFGRDVAIANGRIAVSNGDGGDIIPVASVSIYENTGSWTLVQSIEGDAVPGSSGGFALGGIAMQNDRLLIASEESFSGSPPGHFLAFDWSGSGFVLTDDFVVDSVRGGVALDGDLAVISSARRALLLRFDGAEWEAGERFAPADPADNNGFGSSGLAVLGDRVIVANQGARQLGRSGMGVVYSMQPCFEQPLGFVTCGLGTLSPGIERGVAIATEVGCRVAPGTLLFNSARVGANAIDPLVPNNATSVSVNTELLVDNNCGIDLTPPLVDAAIEGVLGDNDWYVSDVLVDWTAFDPDGTLNTTTGCGQIGINGDGAAQARTCTADSDGGSTSRTITVNRDATPPMIVPLLAGTPGNNGWFISPVSVSFNCTDATSGVADCSPAASVLVADNGRSAPIVARARDLAGNASTLPQSVAVDTVAPDITGERSPANGNGWTNAPVTVDFVCADVHSGIDACPTTLTVSGEGAAQSVSGTARDLAGLETSLLIDDINIDLTPPQMSFTVEPEANAAGWHLDAVTVSVECSDALSGVAVCPEPIELVEQGADVAALATAVDLADNEVTLDAGPIRIDFEAPQIEAAITPAPNADGVRALPITIEFTCTDAVSGVDVCPAPVVLEGSGFDQSVTVETSDVAGNTRELVVDDIDAGIPTLQLLAGDQTLEEGAFLDALIARVTAPEMTTGTARIQYGDDYRLDVALAPEGFDAVVEGAYAWADDGVYTVTVSIEPLVGDVIEQSFEVTVVNVAAEFTDLALIVTDPVRGGNVFEIALGQISTTDFKYIDGGAADSHLASIDWGDGTTESGIIPTESPIGPPSSGSMRGTLTVSHLYSELGSYAGQACLVDDDGAQTCEPFTIEVGPPVSPPVSECSVVVGQPVFGTTDIQVPLQAVIEAPEGASVLSYAWEDADNEFVFSATDSENPIVQIPLDGSDSWNLGVSLIATLQFSDGQTDLCIATGCKIIGADGSTEVCELFTGPDAETRLVLNIDDGGSAATAGSILPATIDLSNTGRVRADEVVLSATVPAGAVLEPGAGTPAWNCDPDQTAGAICTLPVDQLAPEAELSLEFPVRLPNPIPVGLETLLFSASVSALGADPVLVEGSIAVDAAPDLFVDLQPIGSPGEMAGPGERLNFDLQIGNRGDQDTSGAIVTAAIPAGTVINDSATGSRWLCAQGQGQCVWEVGAMAAGLQDSEPLGYIVETSSGNVALVATIADDGASGPDGNPGDNTSRFGITISMIPVPLFNSRVGLVLVIALMLLIAVGRVRAQRRS